MKRTLVFLFGALMFLGPNAALADGYYYPSTFYPSYSTYPSSSYNSNSYNSYYGQNYAYSTTPYTYNASNCAYTYSPYYTSTYVCGGNTIANPVQVQPYNYPYTYPNNNYNYSYDYGCSYYNNCQPQPINNYATPTISYLSPTSGGVGMSVGIYGSGFSATGNSVQFGSGIIANLVSSDGRTLAFTVPSQLAGYGSQTVGLGTYNVSVKNAAGATSNTMPFTVTSLGGIGPTTASASGPSSLGINTQGTWSVFINNQTNYYATVSVSWGDQGTYTAPQTIYGQGQQTLTFTHMYSSYGTYSPLFTITNGSGVQQYISAPTVSVSTGGASGSLLLSYVSPVSGQSTTQVLLVGSGFSLTDNTVHFGIGGTKHVPSQNGTSIYYTIPYFVSPCDIAGPGCAAPAQQVVTGSYPIYVTNNQGTTNTLSFQVQ